MGGKKNEREKRSYRDHDHDFLDRVIRKTQPLETFFAIVKLLRRLDQVPNVVCLIPNFFLLVVVDACKVLASPIIEKPKLV